MSTTISPVTHTADVAVNKAVRESVLSPLSDATGSISSRAPITVAVPNPVATKRVGWRALGIRRETHEAAAGRITLGSLVAAALFDKAVE
ncbi:hypothetical protein R4P65_30925 [Rhodococcus sp. IEGM 1318]|nr:hypothetical protein [Rhodococcus sp. IEGM 1318]MDV8009262.1 hypothetical protein [Rhodococcus sp. IEGM 1318]